MQPFGSANIVDKGNATLSIEAGGIIDCYPQENLLRIWNENIPMYFCQETAR